MAYGRASVLLAEALKELAVEIRSELRGLNERLERVERQHEEEKAKKEFDRLHP